MSRPGVNFLVDAALLLVFFSLLTTSVVIETVFHGKAGDWVALSMPVSGWRALQTRLIVGMAVVVLLHVMLHWAWVCGFIASRISKSIGRRVHVGESARTLYGVATLITLLTLMAAFVLVAALSGHADRSALTPNP